MIKAFKIFLIAILLTPFLFPQGFKVKATGIQKFTFNDNNGRSQATFFSTTPLEDVRGLTTEINGSVTFDINNIASSLKGKIIIPVSSLKTGISKRDKDLRGSGWLDEDQYPDISFSIDKVNKIQNLADNKLEADISGNFMVHGVSKQITADVTMIYLDENEQTRQRAPGDLLGVTSEFTIRLSDYGIDNIVLGRRVSDIIDIGINFVGSNKQD
jgi:polyisoprenoid-binding protein YceI